MSGTNELRTGGQTSPGTTPDAGERRQFWGDTCCDVGQMHNASQRVLELYQKHGCRFTAPSPQQVQDVLQALDSAIPDWEKSHPELFYQTLDSAIPDWEKSHPELFYQTLELNYPELLRRT